MLAFSFIGKKFTCEANLEVADEIGGDGLKLNLKVRETCKQLQKPPGPVLATLHVSVNNGRRNDVTKCKELLTFLKEHVLPKTLKLISLKTIKKVKDEEKNEGVNLLSCIWPGKTKRRKDETTNSCSRGYSSDTEGYSQKLVGSSTICNIDGKHQVSNAGILATPSHARPTLLRKTKLKTDEDYIGKKQKKSPKKKIQDDNVTVNHCLKTSQRISQEKGENEVAKLAHNHATALNKNTKSRNVTCSSSTSALEGTGKDRPDAELDQVWLRRDAGLQSVQNGQPYDVVCALNGRIANSKTAEGGALSKKHEGLKVAQSHEMKLSANSDCSIIQKNTEKKNICHPGHCEVSKSKIEVFAAEYVSRICERAISTILKESSEEVARDLVANVVNLAKCRISQCEKSQSHREKFGFEGEVDKEENDGCEECPSFSKVWKYSQIFAVEREIPESLRNKRRSLKDTKLDTWSKRQEKNDAVATNGFQTKELGNKVMESSPISSYDSLTETSSHSSSQSLELYKFHTKAVSVPKYDFDNELNTDYNFKKTDCSPKPLDKKISESGNSKPEPANDTLNTNAKINASAYFLSLENDEVTSENCNICAKVIPFEEEKECHKKKIEMRNGLGDACSISSLSSMQNEDETRHEKQLESKTSSCSQNNDHFYDKGNVEDDETAKAEGKFASSQFSAEDLSSTTVPNKGERLQPGTKKASKLAAKKQENDGKTESSTYRRPLYKRAISESQAFERKQWCSTEPGDEDLQTTFHGFHSSCRSDATGPKFVRSTSCPVVSEDDVLIESMLSHHEDVYDSLAKRTWIILHVHELWNGGKPMDAIKTCIELTGMADVEKDLGTMSKDSSYYMPLSRDYALFLNILQQLPSSCSMWTLDLCVLVLPKLKGFISTQHHTSHVEMACGVIHVVLKKVSVVARRLSKGNKNKEKDQKVKFCTTELKEIKDMTGDVIQAVKSSKKRNTEDPGSMKQVLKELQLALGTFLSSVTTAS